MNWAKQTEEMFKTWTDTQQKMWDGWMKTLQQEPGQNQAAAIWQKTVATWEETVNNTLKAQQEWTKMWAESLNNQPNVPEELNAWVKQSQEMAKRWSDTQEKLWQNWFDLMKKTEMATMNENWDQEAKKAFAGWQTSAQEMMDAQMEWVKIWAPEEAKAKANSKK